MTDITSHHFTMSCPTEHLISVVQTGGGRILLPDSIISVEIIDGLIRVQPVNVDLTAYPWVSNGRSLSAESWGANGRLLQAIGGMSNVIRLHPSQLTEEMKQKTPNFIIVPAGGMTEATFVFDTCRLVITFPSDSWTIRLLGPNHQVLEREIQKKASPRTIDHVVRDLLLPEGPLPHPFFTLQEFEWNYSLLKDWERSLYQLYWTERAGSPNQP